MKYCNLVRFRILYYNVFKNVNFSLLISLHHGAVQWPIRNVKACTGEITEAQLTFFLFRVFILT